ncbi:hypothetical protein ON010_g6557 [Phytophthora cinnamomi]|nr:hypothetical protein ON010_g6557 [Phytophthora cinnamomi]
MSVLLEAADGLLTLEEVLAFLDSVDSDKSTPCPGDSQMQHDRIKARRPTKRKRGTLSSSTRLQQRKKAEILYLRRLVQELEAQIDKLQALKDGISAQTTRHEISVGMKLAEAQYRARRESEETNRNLKAIMNAQLRTSGVLRDVLHMQASYRFV